jgi:exonuclease III
MKLLPWNYIGISRLAVVYGLRALIRANNPDILSLSEIISPPSLVSSNLNQLGFFSMTHVGPIGTFGGLVLAWRLGVELSSLTETSLQLGVILTLQTALGF